jgi:ATP-binding cassette, subfamily B, bacterial MsbA
MREVLKVFSRFLPNYKKYVTFTVVFNTLATLFGAFSFITLIPILKIIIKIEKPTSTYLPVHLFPVDGLKQALLNNLSKFVGDLINNPHIGYKWALFYVGCFGLLMVFFKTAFTFSATYCVTKIRNNVVKDLRDRLYNKVLSLPMGYFTEKRKGDIISRMTGDVQEIEYSVASPIDIMFKDPIAIIIFLGIMIFMSYQLTIFVLIMFPISSALIGYIGKTLRKKSFKAQTKMGEILSTIEETLGGLRVIKGFNAESKMAVKQRKQNANFKAIMDSVLIRNYLASPLSEFLGTFVLIGVMWFGGSLILMDQAILGAPEFIVYLIFSYSLINPAKNFSTAFYRIQKGLAALDRVDMVLNTESNILIKENPIDISGFQESIEYKDVWFKYQEDWILQDINLKITKGQTIALVGHSGSGKSTMADLLPRFYDVTRGCILVDGVDVRDISPGALRRLMGIVNQEPILFNDTIFNNIAFGVTSATQEEVEYAARIANAHNFILETENGYDTIIGDRGSRLSGGQRQRISIARAVLTNNPIMIFDEATSSLDTESEKLVQEAINNLLKDRTSIVIAHRLSTVRNADVIYVIRDGKIIEQGSYEQLLEVRGEFKKLHDNQFQ